MLEELRTSIISLESVSEECPVIEVATTAFCLLQLNSSTKDLALLLEMTEEKLKLLFSNYTELETQGQSITL